MTDLRIGSLFAGTGALDMAAMEALGGSVAWHCQYDPEDKHQYAARILEHHWPDVPNLGDVTAVDWTTVEPVDVLTAGFPCQDLSYAGRGAGIKEGTRSGLWYSVADAVRALRPRLVFLENVRAIVARRPGLDVVLASLAELGFDAEWTCVRASDVGAPHPRDRWFCIAWPADAAGDTWRIWYGDGGSAQDPHSTVVGERRLTASGQEESRRARADAGRRDRAPAADADGQHERRIEPGNRGGQPEAPAGNRSSAPTDSEGDGRHKRRPEPARIQRGPDAPLGGPSPWGQYAAAVARWEPIVGRPAPAPVNDRGRLSPRFVEWMMGLPSGHVCDVPGLGYNAQTKALGNGVVPQQAAYALRLLLDRARQEVAA